MSETSSQEITKLCPRCRKEHDFSELGVLGFPVNECPDVDTLVAYIEYAEERFADAMAESHSIPRQTAIEALREGFDDRVCDNNDLTSASSR